jgi:integrase
MRLGELLALQWRDVDWHDKFFLVRRSYKRGRLDHTKTGKQRRVDMSNCNGPQLFGHKEILIKRPRTVPGFVPGGPGPGFYSCGAE